MMGDDIVVQKDLTGLWSIDLKGNVNGAVETCGERFHRFDRYLNFSNPLIAKNFDQILGVVHFSFELYIHFLCFCCSQSPSIIYRIRVTITN